MAVVLFVVLAVLVVTGFHVPQWNDDGRLVSWYSPFVGQLMVYSPVIWLVCFSLWLKAVSLWRLARRKAKRKAEIDEAKQALKAPLLPGLKVAPVVDATAAPAVEVAPQATPQLAVPVVVGVQKQDVSRSITKVMVNGAVVAARFIEDKTSHTKRAERDHKAKFARVVELVEAEKRLKKPVIASYIGKSGKPLSLIMEKRGVYVLMDRQGLIVHRLLARNETEAKLEMVMCF